MERLVAEVHESSSVSVLDGEDIVYVARVPTSRIMTVSINVGTRFPAYATSMGRVLLAEFMTSSSTAYLERRRAPAAVAAHGARRPTRCAPSWRRSGGRAGRWSTRSSRRACARWRRRSATALVRRLPAMNLSAHASRMTIDAARRRLVPPLLATAARIEADLRMASKSGTRRSGAAAR